MRKHRIYSPELLKLYRISGIVAFLLLSVSTGVKFLAPAENLVEIVTNLIILPFVLLFIIFPHRLEFVSVISSIFSILIIFNEPSSPMGIMMLAVCLTSLYVRGYFTRYRRIKNCIAILVFLLLQCSQIRFGFDIFINSIVTNLGYAFACTLILFFTSKYVSNLEQQNAEVRKLDLQEFEGLKRRDAEWLSMIQKKIKYESIAIEEKMTVGAVKNRLRIIYSTLDVGDKQGFLNRYADWEICYGDIFSSKKSN